jgi:hypothetical protein
MAGSEGRARGVLDSLVTGMEAPPSTPLLFSVEGTGGVTRETGTLQREADRHTDTGVLQRQQARRSDARGADPAYEGATLMGGRWHLYHLVCLRPRGGAAS